MSTPPSLPYTPAEAEEADQDWKPMCGHYSIAAAGNVGLHQVESAVNRRGGWMNPTMLEAALQSLRLPFTRHRLPLRPANHPGDCYNFAIEQILKIRERTAIYRVQFEGAWMQRSVREQYQHTHYVAMRSGHVMDPMMGTDEWHPAMEWIADELPFTLDVINSEASSESLHITGMHFTHAWVLNSTPMPKP